MRRPRIILAWAFTAWTIVGFLGFRGGEPVLAAEPAAGTWTGGGSIGFLANTPDGTAFAFNLNVDRLLASNLSIGPLLQLGFTGDMNQVGFSGQAKYWIDIPDTNNRAKLVLQGGLGLIHSDFRRDDTSWLIPIGVGLDYTVSQTVSLTTNFLLNFTDLDTGAGTGANVMPGLTFGVRF